MRVGLIPIKNKYCFCDVLAEFFLDIFFIGKKFLAGFYCVFKVFLRFRLWCFAF